MLQLRSDSPATTQAIASAFARLLQAGDLVVLAGEVGAGKTAFAQGLGKALGVKEPITSPTYTLMHSYPMGKLTLYHVDIYRLGSHHEVADLALGELLESDGIVIVEWGDVVAAALGEHLQVRLLHDPENENARLIEVTATGPRWARRWAMLVSALEAHRC